MQQMRWTVSVQREGDVEGVPLATFTRPIDSATAADFGLSLEEGRHLLKVLQETVAQSQVHSYDSARRCCRHCGAYRRIKDWRRRVVATSVGEVRVRVPRVVSCLCTPEPLDDDDLPSDLQRLTECPIYRLVPGRRTPELSYLCAKHGASHPYRVAAGIVSEVTGLRRPCHMTVRRDTLHCGQQLEDAQFLAGWYAGQRRRRSRAQRLRLAIDGTYLTAASGEEVTKFEVVAGRVERDGGMCRRFACALPRRSMARTLVAAALEQSGWAPQTEVEVMSERQGHALAGRVRRADVEQADARLVSPRDEDPCGQDNAWGLRDDTGSASGIHGAERAFGQQDSRFALARTYGGGPRAHPRLDHVAQRRGPEAPALLFLGSRDGARCCHQAAGVCEEELGGHR